MRRTNFIVILLIAAMSFIACGGDAGGNGDNGGSNAALDDGDAEAFCTAAQDFARAIGTAGAPDFEAMQDALAEMEASAPEEIRADVTTVKDAIDSGLTGGGSDNPMQEANVQAANDGIFEYLGNSDCEPPDA